MVDFVHVGVAEQNIGQLLIAFGEKVLIGIDNVSQNKLELSCLIVDFTLYLLEFLDDLCVGIIDIPPHFLQ